LCLDRSINWGCTENRWTWEGKQTMDQGGYRFHIQQNRSFDTCNDILGIDVNLSHTQQFMISFVNHQKVKRTLPYSLTLCSVVLYANFSSVLCRLNNFTFFDVFYFRSFWKRKNNSHNLGLARVSSIADWRLTFLCCLRWMRFDEGEVDDLEHFVDFSRWKASEKCTNHTKSIQKLHGRTCLKSLSRWFES
jgi:hypothetical protein